MLTDEMSYRFLKALNERPDISQRGLAKQLNLSLGKTNYCMQALIDKGLVKAKNFANSSSKKSYIYFLTPHGVEEKARVTARFLRRKVEEYEELEREIELLRSEVNLLRENTTI
ncbi:MAG: MarR family EPS-associated transcriptional regulator [Gammaproteobacteria bacterium]|nr:MarR family EPS-associated transcriptional regulator [Gammaproteobacteria bacterium]